MAPDSRHGTRGRRLPAWLVGLLIAVVVFALTLLALDLLGYGDDPVIVEGAGTTAQIG